MEPDTIPIYYKIQAEFTSQSPVADFGPILTRQQAENQLLALSSRTDVSKATLKRFVKAANGTEVEV